MNTQLPSAAQAKNKAKYLHTKMVEDGALIGHAKSLELVAHQRGFRDWNTMFETISWAAQGLGYRRQSQRNLSIATLQRACGFYLYHETGMVPLRVTLG